jgi:murein DD-endopeptidase MepM/ murein hydrolase activator NlpD
MANMYKYLSIGLALGFLSSCGWVEVPADGQSGKPSYRSPSTSRVATSSLPASNQQKKTRPGYYIVQKGDTVYAISRKFNTAVRSIIDINNLKAPFHLQAGQEIRLPQAPVHIVQAGDTLYSVSRQYHTDVYTLAKTNKLSSPYTLTVGQRLSLPHATNLTTASRNLTATPRVSPTVSKSAKPKPVQKINKTAIPKPPPRSSSRFSWPLQGKIISGFGSKKSGLRNDGINIKAERGTPIKAAENGVVAYSGNELRGFGNMVLIKHSGGWITAYAHADTVLVKRGQKVLKGQKIASVGSTGGVTSPQLHFEIRKGMNAVNPKKHL